MCCASGSSIGVQTVSCQGRSNHVYAQQGPVTQQSSRQTCALLSIPLHGRSMGLQETQNPASEAACHLHACMCNQAPSACICCQAYVCACVCICIYVCMRMYVYEAAGLGRPCPRCGWPCPRYDDATTIHGSTSHDATPTRHASSRK